jgi:Carboxypeptidase regulatory-like domain
MHDRVLICAVVLFALAAPTQAPSPAASLEGTVFNKLTGAPVKSAHVMYIKVGSGAGENAQPISTDTDAGGHYIIQLEAGTYRLWVERPGYARQTYGSRSPEGQGSVISVAAGAQFHDLDMRMVPLGAIAGSVLDEDGDPVQGVGIQVLRFSYTTGRRQLIPVSGASSNDRGEYRAYGLPAGRYLLLATPRSAPMTRPMETGGLVPEAQEPFAPLYYPGVLDPASASEVALAEGGELAGIDFRLPKVRALTVRGRIVSPVEDIAGSQLQVVLAHADGNAASYINRAAGAVDKNTGRFEFHGVAPGSYWLVASQIYRGRAIAGRVPVEVSSTGAPENLALTLTPSFEIDGHVELGGAAAGLSKLNVRLRPTEGLAPGPQPASKVAPDGTIRLAGVTPGLWDFVLDPLPEGLFIQSATFGDADVLRGELNVLAGSPAALRIVLGANGAQISGIVSESGQPSHATVVLAPSAPELRRAPLLFRVVSAGENGVFVFKGVRPGAYKLFAFEDLEPFAWLDSDLVKSVDSMGEPVVVSEGDQATRQLAVIPAEALLPGH